MSDIEILILGAKKNVCEVDYLIGQAKFPGTDNAELLICEVNP